MNIIDLPNGLAKPEHCAIFAPRVGPLDSDPARFWITYPTPDGLTKVNGRGETVRHHTRATSIKRPIVVVENGNQTAWSVLIEKCNLFNVDPHILFVGRPLKIAVEPYDYSSPMSREPKTAYSLSAIYVGGEFRTHGPLETLITKTRSLFT